MPCRLREILPQVQAVVQRLRADQMSGDAVQQAGYQLQWRLQRFRCCRSTQHAPNQKHLQLFRGINEWGIFDAAARLARLKRWEEAAKRARRSCNQTELAETICLVAAALSAPRQQPLPRDQDEDQDEVQGFVSRRQMHPTLRKTCSAAYVCYCSMCWPRGGRISLKAPPFFASWNMCRQRSPSLRTALGKSAMLQLGKCGYP